jgi:hypothetical protein
MITRFTRASIGSALYLANCASDCAAVTTYTAYHLARITFAGTLTPSFSLQSHSLGPLDKNTHVAPCVPLTEFAKSIQLRSPSKLRLREGTRPFSILR